MRVGLGSGEVSCHPQTPSFPSMYSMWHSGMMAVGFPRNALSPFTPVQSSWIGSGSSVTGDGETVPEEGRLLVEEGVEGGLTWCRTPHSCA